MKYAFLFLMLIAINGFSQENLIVSDIVIEGNKVTKKNTVLRELNFKIGDTLSINDLLKNIEISQKNIEKQWLFNFIEFSHTIEDNRVIVWMKVIEKWYVWPYPIFEMSERNFNVFWDTLRSSNFQDFSRLNYGVFLNIYNFRGRNELLKLKFRKGYREHYLFEYKLPYINKQKTIGANLNVELFQMRKFHYNTINNELLYKEDDSKYLKDQKISIEFQYKPGIHNTHFIKLETSNIKVPDVHNIDNNYLPNNESQIQFSSIEYRFNRDSRNSTSYPTSGSYDNVSAQYLKSFDNDFGNVTLRGKSERHIKIGSRMSFGQSINIKLSSNKNLPYILNESLGFENYLRGYEYYVIDGEHYGISKTAIRYNLIPKKSFNVPLVKLEQFKKSFYSIFLSIFVDMGKVIENNPDMSNTLNNEFLYSQGISLDYVTYYDKIIRFEYSRNHLNQWGLFIHFSNPF